MSGRRVGTLPRLASSIADCRSSHDPRRPPGRCVIGHSWAGVSPPRYLPSLRTDRRAAGGSTIHREGATAKSTVVLKDFVRKGG